jgi:hypothetical protein
MKICERLRDFCRCFFFDLLNIVCSELEIKKDVEQKAISVINNLAVFLFF